MAVGRTLFLHRQRLTTMCAHEWSLHMISYVFMCVCVHVNACRYVYIYTIRMCVVEVSEFELWNWQIFTIDRANITSSELKQKCYCLICACRQNFIESPKQKFCFINFLTKTLCGLGSITQHHCYHQWQEFWSSSHSMVGRTNNYWTQFWKVRSLLFSWPSIIQLEWHLLIFE